MKVVVDTSVWSLALRRRSSDAREATILSELLRQNQAILLGQVRQEILTGLTKERFRNLRNQLRTWPDYPLTTAHYEVAASAANACRARGIQGSGVDFLLCAVSHLDRASIFTTDGDFKLYARHFPITLFEP